MTSASGLYLAAFLVVALLRDERPARRVVENAPMIERCFDAVGPANE